MQVNFEKLVCAYETTARRLLDSLKEDLGVENLIRASIEKKIPREGAFCGALSYKIHGIGIRIENSCDEIIIDMELKDGEYIGFDAWRLSSFADTKKDFQGMSEQVVNNEIEKWIMEGKLERCLDPISHLVRRRN